MISLEGQVALVTGANRGIGASIAHRLGSLGATVAFNVRGDASGAQAVIERLASEGSSAPHGVFVADVSDPAAAERMVAEVADRYGRLDVVVNNAGITRDGLAVRMSDEDWAAVIGTNLSGAFYVSRAAAKVMMRQRSGSIVMISSVVGLVGNAGQANYAAAKAGLLGLARSLARELAPRNVRVNAVAPGFITTDMTADLPESVKEAALSSIALKRFGEPEDIADAVAFLASDAAKYITGQVIAVDGGMTFV
ncbi:3-oxoacyl-[acyl-carrier-protein] reductase [Coriobacteriia bacterium Es71-Z0120]|uniref:3-oxoacyl-[acyl-carrier-protein] reductase n=1 Tax=Parvivirga hydrogeniphila TaxID=2939460 RepID=UPI002260CB99|nr:3-oxoacyl-[acyl-carrier-protein] reductase [Parvivirga hydrogeniphila]MCL4079563.1 3-oxoacyl-[acyl-carrier-protein] reductase [Parvivirga hydrogeniphila]